MVVSLWLQALNGDGGNVVFNFSYCKLELFMLIPICLQLVHFPKFPQIKFCLLSDQSSIQSGILKPYESNWFYGFTLLLALLNSPGWSSPDWYHGFILLQASLNFHEWSSLSASQDVTLKTVKPWNVESFQVDPCYYYQHEKRKVMLQFKGWHPLKSKKPLLDFIFVFYHLSGGLTRFSQA